MSDQKLTRKQLVALEKARKGLLVANTLRTAPGHIATLADFDLPELAELAQPGGELLALAGSTYWEQLVCLGFQPERSRLDAVVSIKRASGYSGDLCTNGSPEYVRFFVDWGDGAGFQDVGLASFRAHDISDAPPGPQHPIQHRVSIELDDDARRRFCGTEVIVRARAILSWNQLPPSDPNHVPAFGNRVDADIQIDPRDLLILDLFDEGIVAEDKLPMFDKVDLQAPLSKKVEPTPVPFSQLKEARAAGVEDHRLLCDIVCPLIDPELKAHANVLQPDLDKLAELDFDLDKAIEILQEPASNTSYEELVCVGLDTRTDTLGAVLRIKRPQGYGGNLCRKGSREYVAFWIDWNRDGDFTGDYVGTASVEVHDIASIPADGLEYAVQLPIPRRLIEEHLRGCERPNVVRVRAVLSWSVPPSTTNPNQPTFWGNRLDRLVRLRVARASGIEPDLYFVGGVPVEDIHPTRHLAYPSGGALSGGCGQPATDRPWAGSVTVRGRIHGISPGTSVHYQVQVSPEGQNNWAPVSTVETFRLDVPFSTVAQVITVNAPDGWFEYQEHLNVPFPTYEQRAHLATWRTLGLADGVYDLRLAWATDYPALGTIHYVAIPSVTIDNDGLSVSPTANAVVDTSYDLDLVIDGGDCHSYAQGQEIVGHLRAKDRHFHKWWFDLQPTTHTNGAQASPRCRGFTSLTDQGDDNLEWKLTAAETQKLDKCGYTLTLWAQDRAIVNSNGAIVHRSRKAVGFSIV